jgi:hypothetical protein
MKSKIRLALFASILLSACSNNAQKSAPAETPPPAAETVSPTETFSISGVVQFAGTVPKEARNPASKTPECKAAPSDPNQSSVRVKDGKLANVFVYVSAGLPKKTYSVPSQPAVLDQQHCAYVPRVLGIQVHQPLEIVNSDATLHNVHSLSSKGPFNIGMPMQGMKTNKSFSAPEVMAKIKCDVHPWMQAYVGVMEHPYFAVTSEDGLFSIPDLPGGTLTLTAWHEKLGTKTQEITVAAPAPVVTFLFEGK